MSARPHSDRGSQYLSYDYTQLLADTACCLLRIGPDAYDNALAESFVEPSRPS